MKTGPDISIECSTPWGIQTARWGGTTQAPSGLATVITPSLAYTS